MQSLNLCKSGGAKGADTAFGGHALAAGHQIEHYAFQGMSMLNENKPHRIVKHHLDLIHADEHLVKANEWLGRGDITRYSPYVLNLIRRNWFQVEGTERIYAISYIDDKGLVGGGTGWAVTMGILNGVHEVYVFDQAKESWFTFCTLDKPFKRMKWTELELNTVPMPHGIYTGIGSVEIKSCGLDAIAKIYQNELPLEV